MKIGTPDSTTQESHLWKVEEDADTMQRGEPPSGRDLAAVAAIG
jgi:hypothetical protein